MDTYYSLREELELLLNEISVAEITRNPAISEYIVKIEDFFGGVWG